VYIYVKGRLKSGLPKMGLGETGSKPAVQNPGAIKVKMEHRYALIKRINADE